MAGLIAGDFAIPMERQQYFFDRHLAPWIGRFFADLEAADAADFYRPVGTVGRILIEIETQAFALAE
jgi:TorA maturation chaperone TorD